MMRPLQLPAVCGNSEVTFFGGTFLGQMTANGSSFYKGESGLCISMCKVQDCGMFSPKKIVEFQSSSQKNTSLPYRENMKFPEN